MSPAQARPTVTVIVAAFNASASIETALRTALDQTGIDLECVVVDDASTDETAALVAAMAAADPRIILLRQPANGGVSAARNVALDAAQGEWLTYLDADDRMRPGALRAMLDAGVATDALAVVGQRISTDGERWWYPELYEKPGIREPGVKSIASAPDLLYYVGPPGKLFHRSVAEGLRFEGRMLGDQPWVIRALVRAGDRITVIEDVVYEWWRPHPDHYVPTITSARTRSAGLAAEAVTWAGIAFAVASAAFAETWDPATRARLDIVYWERLATSDLGAQLRRAVRESDPDLHVLLDALTVLVGQVPRDVVAGSNAVMREWLEPAAWYWPLLGDAARTAFWRLAETTAKADPALLDGITRKGIRRPMTVGLRMPIVGRMAGTRLLARAARRRVERAAATPPAAAGQA